MLIVFLLSELSNDRILIFAFKTSQFCPCKHNLVLLPQLKSQLAQSLQSEVFSLPLKSRLGFVLVFGFFFCPFRGKFLGLCQALHIYGLISVSRFFVPFNFEQLCLVYVWHFGNKAAQFESHWCLQLPLKRYRMTKVLSRMSWKIQRSDNGSIGKIKEPVKDAALWGKRTEFLVNNLYLMGWNY